MRINWTTALGCAVLAAFFGASRCPGQSAQGIPEPGLCLYGSITNTLGQIPFLGSGVVLGVAAGTNNLTLSATLVAVNGQVFYVARVPFETRSIPGGPTFGATPNTFELIAAPGTYTCSATVNGTNAVLQGSSTFTFGPADRGRSLRLDLAVNLPRETFAQWSQRIFGQLVDPNADPLGKGMTYYQQYVAGTDPLDPNSVFKFVNVQPASSGAITLQWSSVAGHIYSVLRSSGAAGPFVPLGSNISATPPVNAITDSTTSGYNNLFYRIQVN